MLLRQAYAHPENSMLTQTGTCPAPLRAPRPKEKKEYMQVGLPEPRDQTGGSFVAQEGWPEPCLVRECQQPLAKPGSNSTLIIIVIHIHSRRFRNYTYAKRRK